MKIRLTRRKGIILIVILALLAILALGAGGKNNGGRGGRPQRGAKNENPIPVSIQTLQEETVSDYLLLNGEIQPESSVNVLSDTTGTLINLFVEVGDRVQKGQTIGQIDPSRPGQRFSASPIEAPISGTIVMLNPAVGSQISPQTPVAQIATTDELEIVTNIPEPNISLISRGQDAYILFDAFPDDQFPAYISQLDPQVDPQSRTLKVTLRFTQRNENIRPGMFAQVRIITQTSENSIMAPQETILRRGEDTFVFVAKEAPAAPESEQSDEAADENPEEETEPTPQFVAERRLVEVGLQVDGRAQLLSGVSTGESLIIRGQNLLTDGRSIRIIREEE